MCLTKGQRGQASRLMRIAAEAEAEAAAAKARADDAKAKLLMLMDDAQEREVANGSYRALLVERSGSMRLDKEAFEDKYPDAFKAYQSCFVQGNGTRYVQVRKTA